MKPQGYTTLLFRGGVYPAQVFSSPKVLVVASDTTSQPTEYSCFRDDQASPQALIPAIPSVLVFLAERVGVEPTDAFTSPVFKAGAFDHSAISPFFLAKAAATLVFPLWGKRLCCGGLGADFDLIAELRWLTASSASQ